MVFTDLAVVSGEHRRLVDEHLRWAGFARLANGVQALPGDGVALVHHVEGRLSLPCPLPVASARFDDLAPLVGNGRLSEVFGLAEAGERYAEFVARYRGWNGLDIDVVEGCDAFVVRTMIVHDLRRAALLDPRLPVDLLPPAWPGAAARELAATLYWAVEWGAARWMEDLTGRRAGRSERF